MKKIFFLGMSVLFFGIIGIFVSAPAVEGYSDSLISVNVSTREVPRTSPSQPSPGVSPQENVPQAGGGSTQKEKKQLLQQKKTQLKALKKAFIQDKKAILKTLKASLKAKEITRLEYKKLLLEKIQALVVEYKKQKEVINAQTSL